MTRRLPPLNSLRSFEAAARLASFSKAADELHVTHGAVSRSVRHLEDELGLKLFERAIRKVTLTPAGATYAAHIREALDRLAAATLAVTDSRGAGVITVSTLDSFASKWLVPRLYLFRRAYPEIGLRLDTSDGLANMVTDGIDICVRFGRGGYRGLISELLMPVEVFPACSPALVKGPGALTDPTQLAQATLIHADMDISWDMWLRSAGVKGGDAGRGPVYLAPSLAIQAAIQGEGVVLARSALVVDDLRSGRLVRPFKLSLPAETAYYIVYPPRGLERPKVRAFRDWLVAQSKIGGS